MNVQFSHLVQDFSRHEELSKKMIAEKDSVIVNLNSKARLYPEENIFIPKLSVRKDIFKQETVVTQNLVEDADSRFNNGGDALKSCNKELDKPGERI